MAGKPNSGNKSKPAERRRFEEQDRKIWTAEEREQYMKRREVLAPYIRDLVTPPKEEKKKKDPFFGDLLGVE